MYIFNQILFYLFSKLYSQNCYVEILFRKQFWAGADNNFGSMSLYWTIRFLYSYKLYLRIHIYSYIVLKSTRKKKGFRVLWNVRMLQSNKQNKP